MMEETATLSHQYSSTTLHGIVYQIVVSIMVKFYESSFNYDYPFPAVSLAYFLRYPNPYATHVLSTDVIDRHFDPVTQRLSTTRLHLKRSKLPPAVLKILPKGILGTGGDAGQSYILEKSVVDAKDGWMETETKNLEWTGILSISEKQVYKRLSAGLSSPETSTNDLGENTKYEGTDVTTTVTLLSRFGQAKALRRKGEVSGAGSIPSSDSEDEIPAKKGFFASWSTSSLQRTIEMIGLKRTREALAKSKDGMNVVLGRYRSGGLAQILEGMNEDKHRAFGENGPWKRVWHQGQDSSNED
jgi:4-amino-4-deoxychorismate lyase